jgi:hypothetical protein
VLYRHVEERSTNACAVSNINHLSSRLSYDTLQFVGLFLSRHLAVVTSEKHFNIGMLSFLNYHVLDILISSGSELTSETQNFSSFLTITQTNFTLHKAIKLLTLSML